MYSWLGILLRMYVDNVMLPSSSVLRPLITKTSREQQYSDSCSAPSVSATCCLSHWHEQKSKQVKGAVIWIIVKFVKGINWAKYRKTLPFHKDITIYTTLQFLTNSEELVHCILEHWNIMGCSNQVILMVVQGLEGAMRNPVCYTATEDMGQTHCRM